MPLGKKIFTGWRVKGNPKSAAVEGLSQEKDAVQTGGTGINVWGLAGRGHWKG